MKRHICVLIGLGVLCLASSAWAQIERVGVTPQPQVAQPTGPPGTPVIAGSTSVAQGTTSTPYSATITGTTGTIGNWSLSNSAAGTISGTATATVHWTSSFSGTVAIYCTATNSYGSTPSYGYAVSVTPSTPAVVAGTISPASQTLSLGRSISTISVTGISGGNGTYNYQWQSSIDNTNWTNITTAPNAASYSPGTATGPVYYRLDITSGSAAPAYTASSSVQINDCYQLNTAANPAMNYVISNTIKQTGITSVTDAQINAMGVCDVNQTIQYVDGLGRPDETISVKASPAGKDIVQPVNYDQYGREPANYLPYPDESAAVSGSYRSTAITDQASFYNNPASVGAPAVVAIPAINGITPSYAAVNYELSPLDRPIEQGAPGASWQPATSGISGSGHTMATVYDNNTSQEVIQWTMNSNGNGAYSQQSGATAYYTASMLIKTRVSDENGNTVIEYKDMKGHVVCKRAQNGSKSLDTYYIYDDYDNLTYVVPPVPSAPDPTTPAYPASFAETDAVFLNYIYGYHYDSRERMIQKKIPGKGWQFIVYNTLDQVAMTQDANQRNQTPQQWTFTKYDAQGRVIITGIWIYNGSVKDPSMASPSNAEQVWLANYYATTTSPNWEALNSSTASGYDGLSTPAGQSYPFLSINYYDRYIFTGQPATFTAPSGSITTANGLVTATRTAVLNTIGNPTPVMLWAVNYYDGLGRLIQTFKQHYLAAVASPNNYDLVTNTYDFANELVATNRQHFNTTNATSPAATIANIYIYDHEGRKKQTWEQINGGTNVLLVDDEYNEIGQLMTKNLYGVDGGGAGYQSNISLGLPDAMTSGQTKTVIATNSIIMGTGFTVPAGATFTAQIAGYLQTINYTYNERGWLNKINDPAVPLSSNQLFAEQLNYNTTQYGTTPQYNGNIAEVNYANYNAITGTTTKYTTYTYNPLNKLLSGTSSVGNSEAGPGGNIGYDAMGNITALTRSGANSAILGYTYKDGSGNPTGNLLQKVTNNGGSFKAYTYDLNGNVAADGINAFTYNLLNLPQTSSGSANVTYTYDASGDKLQKISSTNGTTDYISGIQYKTNSTVIDFIQTEEGRVINAGSSWNYEYTLTDHLGNNRATFDVANGKVSEDDYYPYGLNIPGLQTSVNLYLYNKKELQQELSEYDYGARFYDPVIARWTSVDPLAEINRRWSPYNYGKNNPIRNIDPDGMAVVETAQGTTYTGDDAVAKFKELRGQLSDKEPDDNSDKENKPEWSSKDGFYVHQHANRVGLNRGKNNANDPDLMTELDELNAGTEYADSDPFQTGANSYRHAMRNSNQTVAQAKNEADAFVRKQFALAKQLKAEGKVAEAYYQFAIGLHALQDATSPAHAGFQLWSDHPSATQVYNHVKQELFYPGENSNLQKVTNQYLDWFQKSNAPLPSGNLFDGIKHD